MLESIVGLLSTVDKKIIYVIVGLFIILAIVSIIKKAVKLAIFICIIAVVLTFSSTIVDTLTNKAGIAVKSGVLYIDNDYISDFSIDLISVENVTISNENKDSKDEVVIVANKKENNLEIPSKYTKVLKYILAYKDIKVIDKR